MITDHFAEFFSGVTQKPTGLKRLKTKIREEMMKNKLKRMFTKESEATPKTPSMANLFNSVANT